MKKILFPLLIIAFASCNDKSETKGEKMSVDSVAAKKEIIAVMDSMNSALKTKNVNQLLSYFTDDGMYYGTDPKEVWSKKQFSDEATKTMNDSTANFSYDIERRDVMLDDDGNSAVVVEQFLIPMLSNKIMARGIGRLDKKDNTWRIDFYSWNMIPKNEDLPKVNKALE